MKTLITTVLILILVGCKNAAENDSIESISVAPMPNIDKSLLGKKLIEQGFLKYADASKIVALKKEITESFDIYQSDSYKITHIDAEELAELSFDFFVPELKKILTKRNIKLSVSKTADIEKTFTILINNEPIQLYTQNDLNSDIVWEIAPRRFFIKLNEILKAGKCEEQFYLLYGGNDLQSILLTPDQFKIIEQYYKGRTKEIPYTP